MAQSPRSSLRRTVLLSVALIAACGTLAAQPAEVDALGFDTPTEMVWASVPGSTSYRIYEGPLSWVSSGVLLNCGGSPEFVGTAYSAEHDPGPDRGVYFLVTAVGAAGEGSPGRGTDGVTRYLEGDCERVVRHRVLGRVGFGWSAWSREQYELLGAADYLEQQLDPASIDESTNLELAERRALLEPPARIRDLQALNMVEAIYARRQLEHRLALFWSNHFNTDYGETEPLFNRYSGDQLDLRRLYATKQHQDELELFRRRALNGNFRQILEDSALSPAMILYLDTADNVAGRPNENYARELLELHTMGVDGGYTHHEIDDIARAMTGWQVCKKETTNLGSYTTPCIATSLIGTPEEPEGDWVLNLRPNKHDCQGKMLFHDSAQQMHIPDTCSSPEDGVNDLFLVLDALATHPAAARLISKKLLQHFVTDFPTEAMIANVLAVWYDPSNPHGVGDLGAVTRAVLGQAEFLDVDAIAYRRKIKTPFEHLASGFRAVRGRTNGDAQVRSIFWEMLRDHMGAAPGGVESVFPGYSAAGLPGQELGLISTV